MDQQDRKAIEDLFGRLNEAERQAGPRDGEAQALIDDLVRRQPASTYFMAQTIVMQNYALEDAQQRIEDLEARLAQREAAAPQSGGFLSGLFGGRASANTGGSVPAIGGRRSGSDAMPASGAASAARPPQMPQRGSFLAGAAQTAMGVAGGVLLGNAVASMFGSDPAKAGASPASDAQGPATAADNTPAEESIAHEEEPAEDEGGFFDSFFGDDEF